LRWRRAGWKAHSVAVAPSVVSDRLWTGRGRKKEWDRGPPLAGNHRCIFVSVCQSPVLTGALAGGACLIPGGCRCRRWPREGAV